MPEAASRPRKTALDLLEREDALGALRAALERARQGHGGCALVCGEAGIGKTTLLKAALVQSPRTFWGGCEALFSPRPLGPLHDMAPAFGERVRAALAREGARSELFALLLAELRDARLPTTLVFEDLHWADEATLDCVKFLARRIESAPVLLVLSYRDDELGEAHPLRAVLGDLPAGSVERVVLSPLSAEGVQRLAQASGGDARALHAATRGNPFFVTECLRAEGLPGSVRDAVLARAARQPAPVRALLDLAAIVPGRIEGWLVQAVLQPATAELAAALGCGLLVAEGRAFAFRHELARIALEQALAPPVAAHGHARVLAQLEGRAGVAPARLVHHAAAAGDGAAVLRHAPAAAERAAAQGAHREAAQLLAAALEHAGALPAREHAALLERRAYECYLVDMIGEAIAAREAALAIWRAGGEREREAHTLRWLSRLNWFAGRTARAQALAEEAWALLRALPVAGVELAWATSNLAQLHMLKGEDAAAVERGGEAIALAESLGATEVLVHALNNVGTARYAAGLPEGDAALRRSLELALAHDLGEHVARAYVNLVSNSVKWRDYAAAARHGAAAHAYFAARDLDSWSNYLDAWMARAAFEQCRWDEAAERAGRLLQRRRIAPISRLPALVVLAHLRLRRGDPGAWPLLEEATALAQETGELQRLAPVAAAHAEAAWLGEARADLALVRAVIVQARQLNHPETGAELAFWLALAEGSPFEGAWEAAAARWQALGCRFERAMVQHAGGDAGAQHEALAELESLGAAASAARLREAMRRQGLKGIARGPRASTADHPAGLTRREAQILVLVAQGLTNAEIATRLVRSAKTVDHHVSALLAKLGARSRAEAAAIAARLGLLDAQNGER